MAGSSSGIPKRARNDRRKQRRASSWAAGKVRRKDRHQLQLAAQAHNELMAKQGIAKPWDLVCAARRDKRQPLTEAWQAQEQRERLNRR